VLFPFFGQDGQGRDHGPFLEAILTLWQDCIVPGIPNGLFFIGFYFIIPTVSW